MEKYKTLFFFLSIFISASLIGCDKNIKNELEKDIAIKIAEYIVENDSLKSYSYSGGIFLHIASKNLGSDNFKTYVALNGVKSNPNHFKIDTVFVSNFKTVIYYNLDKKKFNLAESFFVPDSKSWRFLTEMINGEFYLNKIETIFIKTENMPEEINEPDF